MSVATAQNKEQGWEGRVDAGREEDARGRLNKVGNLLSFNGVTMQHAAKTTTAGVTILPRKLTQLHGVCLTS